MKVVRFRRKIEQMTHPELAQVCKEEIAQKGIYAVIDEKNGFNDYFRPDYSREEYSDREIWGAMTDGMYGDYPDDGFDGDYEFMGY